MLQRLRAARKNEDGFTLVELLIVIIILGVLAGIVLFAVAGVRDKGVASACKTDKQTVQTAVDAMYANTGAYPTSANADPAAASDERIGALITAKLLKAKPPTDTYDVTVTDNLGAVSAKLKSGADC